MAVNGVCLTVRETQPPSVILARAGIHNKFRSVDSRLRGNDESLVSDIMPETLKVTTLGSLETGDRVNLEPALKYGDELGGHLVLGHVDGVGKIVARKKRGNSVVLTISHPRELEKYIFHKGSIAVDGVSLTIMKHETWPSVSLTPYTLQHTNFGKKKVGDKVNLEVDVLARYAQVK